TATCVVTVTPKIIAVESISLDKTSISLEELATQTLVASILPDTATDQTIAWTTSAAEVATVVEGLVTAKKAGQATITATAGSATATCAVTVTAPTAGSIAITGAKELYATGEDMIVSLDVTMSNGVIKNYANVNLATGLNKPEGATISGFDTATDGKKSGTINIDSKTSTINYVVYQAVDSEATLRALLESKTEKTSIIIGLTKDITITKRYNVARPFILYGITSEADKNISINTTADTRVFNFDASVSGCESLLNSSIEFHNITMEVNSTGTYLRANSFWGCGAINVIYDNAILKTNNYYALHIAEENNGAHFTIKNKSIISGWAAINLWSSETTIDIDNSTLIGTNNHSGISNDFTTIAVNAPKEGIAVLNNVINIKDSTINAIANAADTYQYCIDLRNESAKVNFSGANSVSTVKKDVTNKTPCYIRGFALTQIVGIESVTTTDVPPLPMFMTRTEVDAII
ncbi:MAG: Ig-like domain-containing protein, partial [Bacilli bacterium]